MTIDEKMLLLKEEEIAKNFQKIVDTHIVEDAVTLEELCCDDTEVIEEELERCQELADYHNQIANTLHKYQKIVALINSWELGLIDNIGYEIEKVLEDDTDK